MHHRLQSWLAQQQPTCPRCVPLQFMYLIIQQRVLACNPTNPTTFVQLWQHSEPSANLATLSNGISSWFSSAVTTAETAAAPATSPAPSRV